LPGIGYSFPLELLVMGAHTSRDKDLASTTLPRKKEEEDDDDDCTDETAELAPKEVAVGCAAIVRPIRNAFAELQEGFREGERRRLEAERLYLVSQEVQAMTAAFVLACTWGDLATAKQLAQECDMHAFTSSRLQCDISPQDRDMIHGQKADWTSWNGRAFVLHTPTSTRIAALQGACQNGHVDVIEWLLTAEICLVNGADNTIPHDDQTQPSNFIAPKDLALVFADGHCYTEQVLQLLYKRGRVSLSDITQVFLIRCPCGRYLKRREGLLFDTMFPYKSPDGNSGEVFRSWLAKKYNVSSRNGQFYVQQVATDGLAREHAYAWKTFVNLKNGPHVSWHTQTPA
jgi:hypothetical protein